MSAPQPPNPPWQGGQPQQEPGQSGPEYTAPPGDTAGADGVERTQAIRPGQPVPGQDESDRTQVVQPGQTGAQPGGGDATQMVPPGSVPQSPPYAPPPSAADLSSPAGGFGQPPNPYGQQQPGQFGQQPPPGQYGQPQQQNPYGQPGPYGQPQGGFAQQGGLGYAPQMGGQGANTGVIATVIQGAVALLGLISLILSIVSLSSVIKSASYDPADGCDTLSDPDLRASCVSAANRYAGDVGGASALSVIIAVVLLLASATALAGAVLLFLKKTEFAHLLVLGGGAALLVLSIVLGASYYFTGGVITILVFGLLITAAGALWFFPQTKPFLVSNQPLGGLGGGPKPPAGPGGYGQPQQHNPYGPPPGQQQHNPYGQQQPGQFGQQPPPGQYGQPQQQNPYGQPPGGQPQQPPQQW
ncbi:hypothetical protein [Actinokineospora spheciospongiae]|nr:hypothetical protein [Actinokineospora spheciospongiae]